MSENEKLERPRASASKKDWAAYAASLGITVENETRDQIVELVNVHEANVARSQVTTAAVITDGPPELPGEQYGAGDDGKKYPELPVSYPAEGGDYYVNVVRVWGPIVVGIVPKGWHGGAPLQVPLEDVRKIRDVLNEVIKKHEGQV